MKMMKRSMMVLLTLSLSAAPVAAGAQAQQQPQTAAPASQSADPNEVICERQTVVGSRLAHRKVCLTRSQWQESRRQDRGEVEKVQTQRGMHSEGINPG